MARAVQINRRPVSSSAFCRARFAGCRCVKRPSSTCRSRPAQSRHRIHCPARPARSGATPCGFRWPDGCATGCRWGAEGNVDDIYSRFIPPTIRRGRHAHRAGPGRRARDRARLVGGASAVHSVLVGATVVTLLLLRDRRQHDARRAERRRRELAVRAALGASRSDAAPPDDRESDDWPGGGLAGIGIARLSASVLGAFSLRGVSRSAICPHRQFDGPRARIGLGC